MRRGVVHGAWKAAMTLTLVTCKINVEIYVSLWCPLRVTFKRWAVHDGFLLTSGLMERKVGSWTEGEFRLNHSLSSSCPLGWNNAAIKPVFDLGLPTFRSIASKSPFCVKEPQSPGFCCRRMRGRRATRKSAAGVHPSQSPSKELTQSLGMG